MHLLYNKAMKKSEAALYALIWVLHVPGTSPETRQVAWPLLATAGPRGQSPGGSTQRRLACHCVLFSTILPSSLPSFFPPSLPSSLPLSLCSFHLFKTI